MNLTYDEILNSMKNKFFEISGENVDLNGDLGARFKAVASELFSLKCYGDYILKQAFAKTATGQYLDRHAEMRGITRKTPTGSTGTLTFGLIEPAPEDVAVEKGTICSCAGRPYIQFSTDENAVIPAGELSVTVNASSTEAGEQYNAAAGEVTVMVNPPQSVYSVVNETPFTGGYDEESDGALQKRIAYSYSVPSNGVSAESMRNVILKTDDITDCLVKPSDSKTICVYVRTKSGELTQDTIDKVKDALMISQIALCDIQVSRADSYPANMSVEAYIDNFDTEDTEEQIKNALVNYIDSLSVEENLILSRAASAVCGVEGVKFCDVMSSNASNGVIYCPGGKYFKFGTVTVKCYEQ